MPSFDRPTDTEIPPSGWIERYAHLVRHGGRVLDVAAGHGRHTRFFAARGCHVTAVDLDASGLSDVRTVNAVTVLEQDLETRSWPFDRESFDAIVVTNYLHRPHFPKYIETLFNGGVLLIETFGAGNEKLGRPRNPDFLLHPNELLTAFSGDLQIIAYEYGIEHVPRSAVRQRLCAVKAPDAVDLKK